jgi:hypothetical protein
MMRTLVVSVGILAALAVPRVAHADGARYAVIVQGASGDPQYADLHRSWVDALSTLMKQRLGLDPSKVIVLAEVPKPGELRGTAEDVKATLGKLAKEAKPEDLVFIMLIGHGSGADAAAKFNLVGPDMTVDEWKTLLEPMTARAVIVDSTSSSFPFLAGLAGKNRIVITASNSYAQKYHTVFADAFIKAMTAPEADADQNGRVSVLEVFNYASRLVAQHYERVGYMSTETAIVDDTGDGKGRAAAATGEDGTIAAFTYLDVVAAPKSADPEVQALLDKQQTLIEQVDELRRRKNVLPPDLFEKEFERLIVDLSVVSRDVRRKTIKK